MAAAMKPLRRHDLVWREVDGEVVIISPDAKSMHVLNEIGTRIWSLLDGEHDAAAIAAILSREFDEQEETIRRDALEYLSDLRRLNLLE
jgi:hypothetical protein